MLVFGVQNYLEFKLFQGRSDTDPACVHLAALCSPSVFGSLLSAISKQSLLLA